MELNLKVRIARELEAGKPLQGESVATTLRLRNGRMETTSGLLAETKKP